MIEKEESKVINQAAVQIPQNVNTITLLEALEILWNKKAVIYLLNFKGNIDN